MHQTNNFISVIIAAYNESNVIESNIKDVLAELQKRKEISYEIIVVNDGSSDNTAEILDGLASKYEENLKIIHQWRNYGQGKALRTGIDIAQGKILITLDADLSYGPEYIWKLYDKLVNDKVEIVLASPYMDGGLVKNVPYYRYFLSKYGNKYLSKMSHYKVSTITCVVRAYRREVFDEIYLSSDGMEFQLEVLMKAYTSGFRVTEIPAELIWRKEKKAEASITRVSKMRILRSIKLYLYMGWLSKPSTLFMILAFLSIIPGIYILAWMAVLMFKTFLKYLNEGHSINWSISYAMSDMFKEYTYSFAFGFSFSMLGIIMLIFALLTIQNKYYFEELYKINQKILKENNKI